MNLKELYVDNLHNLEILNFENSKLDLLTYGNFEKLKYINGYFKEFDNIIDNYPNVYKQKVICRRRIFLLNETLLNGKENKCICGKCGKYVLKNNKVNIRKTEIEYPILEEGLDYETGYYDNVKLLTCC